MLKFTIYLTVQAISCRCPLLHQKEAADDEEQILSQMSAGAVFLNGTELLLPVAGKNGKCGSMPWRSALMS